MLIFGPFRSIPRDEDFVVFNLTSQTQVVPRLPGLFVLPNQPYQPQDDGQGERAFDYWYYEYVLNDPTACTSLINILTTLYEGRKVYVCIADYSADPMTSILNESFMKLIQARYDIKYSIINDPEDYYYIPRDGCDFMSVAGIRNFDSDRRRFLEIYEANRIMYGGAPTYDED